MLYIPSDREMDESLATKQVVEMETPPLVHVLRFTCTIKIRRYTLSELVLLSLLVEALLHNKDILGRGYWVHSIL